MRVRIRSWNLFHGRTFPPGRTAHLHEAVRLAVREDPDVVCLQEVPVWGLGRLGDWSGMAAVTQTTVRAGLGPLSLPPWLARGVTDIHHAWLRSLLTGQGNAILVGRRLEVVDGRSMVLNDGRFRRDVRSRLRLSLPARVRWAVEPRIAQAVRLGLPGGATVVVVNVHASHIGAERRLADAELGRAAAFAERYARPGEAVVLAGDFNVVPARSATMGRLAAAGYSPGGPGIDHILVHGAQATPLEVWPESARRVGGRLLSDHAPVELELEL